MSPDEEARGGTAWAARSDGDGHDEMCSLGAVHEDGKAAAARHALQGDALSSKQREKRCYALCARCADRPARDQVSALPAE